MTNSPDQPHTQIVDGFDDLVISRDKTRAYCACHREDTGNSFLTAIDIEKRCISGTIVTSFGTYGLTMTNDEQYVVASNGERAHITFSPRMMSKAFRP